METFGLILGHLVGDYIVQNDWMAKNKTNTALSEYGIATYRSIKKCGISTILRCAYIAWDIWLAMFTACVTPLQSGRSPSGGCRGGD